MLMLQSMSHPYLESLAGFFTVLVPLCGAAVTLMKILLDRSLAQFKIEFMESLDEGLLDKSLAQFQVTLIRELNGTYIRRTECDAMHANNRDRVSRLEVMVDRHVEKGER
jgi:hypothetical protein